MFPLKKRPILPRIRRFRQILATGSFRQLRWSLRMLLEVVLWYWALIIDSESIAQKQTLITVGCLLSAI
jgi:hypothetical protein